MAKTSSLGPLWQRIPCRGSLFNVVMVLLGSGLGLVLGGLAPVAMQSLALSGIGAITVVIAIKMALQTKNVIVMIASLILGGVIGVAVGIPQGFEALAEYLRTAVGGRGRFNEGLITASVLFCVGPMTLIGCLEDGMEAKSDLLLLKGSLDGVTSFFLAASLGTGVAFSALSVFVVQCSLTLAATKLKWLAERKTLITEATAVGGVILVLIGLNLLDLKKTPTEAFLPALFLAPLFAAWFIKEEE